MQTEIGLSHSPKDNLGSSLSPVYTKLTLLSLSHPMHTPWNALLPSFNLSNSYHPLRPGSVSSLGKPQETPLPVGSPAALGAALHRCCRPHPRHRSQTDSPSLEGRDCASLLSSPRETRCGAHSETVADSDELIELIDRLSLSSNTTRKKKKRNNWWHLTMTPGRLVICYRKFHKHLAYALFVRNNLISFLMKASGCTFWALSRGAVTD